MDLDTDLELDLREEITGRTPVTDALVPACQPTADAACLRPQVLDRIAAVVEAERLPLNGRQYLAQALKAPMDRASRGRMRGAFPSTRMGVSMAIEYGWLGMAALEELEGDHEGTVAFIDKPPLLKRIYERNGRRVGSQSKPTLIRIGPKVITLVDVIPEHSLLQWEKNGKSAYVRTGSTWTCPGAIAGARELGFEHEVWTEQRYTPTEVANRRILNDFRSFDDDLSKEHEIRLKVVEQATQALGAPLISELVDELGTRAGLQDVYRAIAYRRLFIDLRRDNLSRPENVRVYSSELVVRAHLTCQEVICTDGTFEPCSATVKVGAKVRWDGVVYDIKQLGTANIVLCDPSEHLLSLTHQNFRDLLATEKLTVVEVPGSLARDRAADALDALLQTSPENLERAVLRMRRIQPYLAGLIKSPESRTERRYLAAFRAAEAAHGNGFLGLIPGRKCGNREARLHARVIELAHAEVAKYDGTRKLNRSIAHKALSAACEKEGHPAPTYSWFCGFIRQLNQYKLRLDQMGRKAAYGIRPRRPNDVINPVEVEPVEAWDRAHVDHTEIDLEGIFEETGENLGRPWLSLLVDHATRKTLSLALTYDPPSYRSVQMVMRDCVRRHSRLPRVIVFDGGKEFGSRWFQTMGAALGVILLPRPGGEPRAGSQGERMFGTVNTSLVHQLAGNTDLTKNVRQLVKELDPQVHAVWSLPRLLPYLEQYLFGIYENLRHREIGTSPANAFALSTARTAHRKWRAIAYTEAFFVATASTTRTGKATVTPDGVKINYFHYNNQVLFSHLGKKVPVRFDGQDVSRAWAFVNGSWVRLTSRYHRLLHGMSERQIELITQEYRKQRSDVEHERLHDRSLAKFIEEAKKTERHLLEIKRNAWVLALREKEEAAGNDQQPAAAVASTGTQEEAPPEGDDEEIGINLDLETLDLEAA